MTPDREPTTEATAAGSGLRRRTVLAGGLGAVGGAALALGVTGRADLGVSPEPVGGGAAVGLATTPFRGEHQAGIATPAQAHAAFVGLDLAPDVDRSALVRLMRIWTGDIERLTAGRPALADTEPELASSPARLTVTVGYGAGLLTAAGLDHLRPSWLGPLPAFGVDRLEDRWSGGDAVLQVCADDPVTVAHAVRVLTGGARTFAQVRWVQRGFRYAVGTQPARTTMRNLMGQVDGTRNLSPGTADDSLLWRENGEPGWLVGGTAMVLRRITMDLDAWEQLGRTEREAVIGRRLADGAPLTGTAEHDEPDLDATTPLGLPVIDTFAHIRRARTENPDERFLRRGYNFDEAPPPGQRSHSGIIFVTFQADVERQFVPVQRRLDQLDLLNRWTTPVGSAVFAVPPGCGPQEYLGQQLLGA